MSPAGGSALTGVEDAWLPRVADEELPVLVPHRVVWRGVHVSTKVFVACASRLERVRVRLQQERVTERRGRGPRQHRPEVEA